MLSVIFCILNRREFHKYFLVLLYLVTGLSFCFCGPIFTTQRADKAVTENYSEIYNSTLANLDYDTDPSNSTEEEIKDLNLETIQQNLNEEDLYEHESGNKTVEERSFIFIHGPRIRVSHINPRMQSPQRRKNFTEKSNYKTFVSNVGSVESLGRFDDLPFRFDNDSPSLHEFKDLFSEIKNTPTSNYYPAKDPYYSGSLAHYIQNEMSALSQEMKNTKGILEQQIQDQKLKEDLINLQFQYPGLMKGDIRKFPYPKDRRISMNLKVESDLQRGAATGVHEGNLKQIPLNIDSEQYNGPNQQFEVTKKFNRSNAKTALQSHNVPPFPSIKTVEDHHEYVELLKPPLVRSKVKGNEQNMFNKIPDRTYIQNPTNINPNDPRSSYGFKKQFMQDALRGDYHRNEIHGPNSKTVPYYEEDEEQDFHDTRLIKKLQEIKKLDAALPDVSVSLESDNRKDPMTDTYRKNVVQSNRLKGNKGKCVYPGCDAPKYYKVKSNKQQKCKCKPNNSQRTSSVSGSQETIHGNNPRSTESEESLLS